MAGRFLILAVSSLLLASISADLLNLKDEYLVQFRGKAPSTMLGRHSNNVRILKRLEAGRKSVWLVKADSTAMKLLGRHPEVKHYEPNVEVSLVHPQSTKSQVKASHWEDDLEQFWFDDQCHVQGNGRDIWGLVRTSHEERPNYESYPYAYEDATHESHVYVLDSGVDIEHPEFEGRARYGMVASSLNEGETDLNGHGTHVASLVIGKTWGAAKHGHVKSCKVLNKLGMGTTFAIVEGINYVLDQAHRHGKTHRAIMSLSIGLGSFSQLMYDAMQEAYEAGVIIVAAAGNSATSELTSPASHDHSIAVGATDDGDKIAPFSCYGPGVHIYAPGVDINGAWARGLPQCNGMQNCGHTMSGTSMATPLVAGIIARKLALMSDSEVLNTTPADVKAQLISASVDVLSMSYEHEKAGSHNRLLHMDCQSNGGKL